MSYYALHYADGKKNEIYGCAYAPQETDLFILPDSGVRVISWQKLVLRLKDGDFCDYLANDLGGRLCSKKLKLIVDRTISPKDRIQWLDTIVIDKNGQERDYYLLHFPVNFPVVNKKNSIMSDELVVKPVFSKNEICNLNVFTLPDTPGITIYISKILKKSIIANNCTGVAFSRVPIVL